MNHGSTLIVCFDGLRRDRTTPDRMPNLHRFMAEGVDMVNSRSVFPSETRVAVSSVVTGSSPGSHGLVANQFFHREVAGDALFRTARHQDLQRADARGVLIDRESLGERLARAGRRYAVVSTASPGATWMMNHRAATLGQPVFSVYSGVGSAAIAESASDRFGPVPEAATPNTPRIDYACRVLTELIYPDYRPDLALLWFSDPDITAHGFGIDAAQTVAAQRGCDDAFARLLSWWRRGDGPQNILVMSDHGQITGERQIDLASALPGHEGELAPGYFSSLHLRDAGPAAIASSVEMLAQQAFIGLIFAAIPGDPAASVPGALPASLLGGGHHRAAPVSFTLKATAGAGGMESCLFTSGIKPGGGMHGGLARGELSTVLAASGPAFRAKSRSPIPCWLPDIAPTLLTVLALSSEGMDGRVLAETLAGDAGGPPEVSRRALHATIGTHSQGVEQWLVEGKPITDFGWSATADETRT